jgi:hypothetical protein
VTAAPKAGAATGVTISTIIWHWAEVPAAAGYKFYPSAGGGPIPIGGAGNNSYTQTGLSTNTAYGALVSAVNGGGESKLTKLTTTYTLADEAQGPFVIEIGSVTNKSAALTWNPDTNPAGTDYIVDYWTIKESTKAAKATKPFTLKNRLAPAYDVTGLTANTTYFFEPRAENHAGILSSSLIAAAPPAVSTVTWLTATNPGNSVARPKWNWNIPAGKLADHSSAAGAGPSLGPVTVFPIPWMPGSPSLNFVNMPAGTTITINSADGTTVKTLRPTGAAAFWNGKDESGAKVPNGAYTALLVNGGSQRVFNLTIQR